MKILLGTKSIQKTKILEKYLDDRMEYELLTYDVDSEIVDQPLDLDTTKEGAINRAQNSVNQYKKTEEESNYLAVGLEAGLIDINEIYNLVCVAAIIDCDGNISLGLNDPIVLPKPVSSMVKNGVQFGDVIREYRKEIGDGADTGLIKRVDELIDRNKCFSDSIARALEQAGCVLKKV